MLDFKTCDEKIGHCWGEHGGTSFYGGNAHSDSEAKSYQTCRHCGASRESMPQWTDPKPPKELKRSAS